MLQITMFRDREEKPRHYASHPFTWSEFGAAIWLVRDGRLYDGLIIDVCDDDGKVTSCHEVIPGRSITSWYGYECHGN